MDIDVESQYQILRVERSGDVTHTSEKAVDIIQSECNLKFFLKIQ